jgi:hypothetical protein
MRSGEDSLGPGIHKIILSCLIKTGVIILYRITRLLKLKAEVIFIENTLVQQMALMFIS